MQRNLDAVLRDSIENVSALRRVARSVDRSGRLGVVLRVVESNLRRLARGLPVGGEAWAQAFGEAFDSRKHRKPEEAGGGNKSSQCAQSAWRSIDDAWQEVEYCWERGELDDATRRVAWIVYAEAAAELERLLAHARTSAAGEAR